MLPDLQRPTSLAQRRTLGQQWTAFAIARRRDAEDGQLLSRRPCRSFERW